MLAAQNSENANRVELQNPSESQRFQSHLQLQLQNQISHPVLEQPHNNISKYQNVFTERDFEFVSKTYFLFKIYTINNNAIYLHMPLII